MADAQVEILESLSKAEVFSQVEPAVLQEIAGLFRPIHFDAGQTFIRRGEDDDRMFIIRDGRVSIHHESEVLLEMGPGEILGEMALLDSGRRTMSVTTIEPTNFYYIQKDSFLAFMRERSEIAIGIIDILIARFRSLNRTFIRELRNREMELSRLVEQKTRDLTEKNEELLRTQRYKEQFLANMSHEIRTPLNAIVGMVNLLRKTRVDETQSSYLKYIKDASENLQVIIDDILDFSKLEAGKIEIIHEPFEPREVISLVHNMLRFKTEEKGLTFTVHIDEKLPQVLIGDDVRLNQVLVNLTGNAIKFTDEGSIYIGVEVLSMDEGQAEIMFRVRDSGIGIAPDQQDHIFEKFAQAASDTKRKFGGTGLGLSISKQLVEMQGGSIGLESEMGVGSTFYFQIPYAIGEARDEQQEVAPQGTDQELLKGISILMVEDNELNVMVAEDTLTMEIEGVEVIVASNGLEALERLRERDFDIVLMDLQMPEMDGYDASRAIRSEFDPPQCRVPIVAMTASVTKAEVDRCFAVGMNNVVAKPFEPDELLRKMAKAIHG